MFGDKAKEKLARELREIEEKLEAAPRNPNPRKWVKYFKNALQGHRDEMDHAQWLIDQYNSGFEWGTEDEAQINKLAQNIRSEEKAHCESVIKQNEHCIQSWQVGGLEGGINGYGELVVARLSRENAGRREAIKRAERVSIQGVL